MLNLFNKYYKCDNINELYKKCSILKVIDIYKFKVAIMMQKMLSRII